MGSSAGAQEATRIVQQAMNTYSGADAAAATKAIKDVEAVALAQILAQVKDATAKFAAQTMAAERANKTAEFVQQANAAAQSSAMQQALAQADESAQKAYEERVQALEAEVYRVQQALKAESGQVSTVPSRAATPEANNWAARIKTLEEAVAQLLVPLPPMPQVSKRACCC